MRLKSIFFFILIFFTFIACDGDSTSEKTCQGANPVEDLPWLSAKVEEMENYSLVEFFYITRAEYKRETVFIFKNCCPNCASIYYVYNCEGEEIGSLGEGDINPSSLKNETVIWQHENTGCNF